MSTALAEPDSLCDSPLIHERGRHGAQIVHHVLNLAPKIAIARTLGHENFSVEFCFHGVNRVVVNKHVGIPLRGIPEIAQAGIVLQMSRRLAQATRKLHALIEPINEKRVKLIFFGGRKTRRRRAAARSASSAVRIF